MEDCFEIFYDEKPYRRLSYSERVFCNLEIAKFLRKASKKNVPMFLDNSESISSIPKDYINCEQVFLCKVVPGQDLEVTIVSQ